MAEFIHIEPDSNSAHLQLQLTQDDDQMRHPTRVCVGLSPLLHLLTAIVRKHQLQYHLYADDAQLYVDLSGVWDGEAAEAVCHVK